MSFIEVTIPRMLNKGKVNPVAGKVFSNMEEKISEALSYFGLGIPLERCQPIDHSLDAFTSVNPAKVIGHITEVTPDECKVRLNEYGVNLLSPDHGIEPVVGFCIIVDMKAGTVDRITKAYLGVKSQSENNVGGKES